MSTQSLHILASAVGTGWALWHDNALHPMGEQDALDALSRGEISGFIHWSAQGDTSDATPVQRQLTDFCSQHRLQRSTDCQPSQRKASEADEPRVGTFELTVELTQRIARKVLVTAGLDVADNVVARPKKARSPLDEPLTFEQKLRFWLASAGIDGEHADKVCASRRLAACIKDSDAGDTVRELPSALYCLPRDVHLEALSLVNNPLEQLRLMTFLR